MCKHKLIFLAIKKSVRIDIGFKCLKSNATKLKAQHDAWLPQWSRKICNYWMFVTTHRTWHQNVQYGPKVCLCGWRQSVQKMRKISEAKSYHRIDVNQASGIVCHEQLCLSDAMKWGSYSKKQWSKGNRTSALDEKTHLNVVCNVPPLFRLYKITQYKTRKVSMRNRTGRLCITISYYNRFAMGKSPRAESKFS